MTSNYVQGHSDAIIRGHGSRTASNSCKHFLHLIKSTDHILDVGCGPGSITATLAQHVPQGKITGIDMSEAVLEKAKQQENLPENCLFQTGDATKLPFPDSSFDIVHTSQVVAHMKKPIPVLAKLRRVCKPGGFVACREGDAESGIMYPSTPGNELMKTAMIAVSREHASGSQGGRALLAWAIEAGFSPDQIEYSGDSITYAGKQRAWWAQVNVGRTEDATWRKNILAAAYTESDIKTMKDAIEEWGKVPSAVYTIFCGQVVCFK